MCGIVAAVSTRNIVPLLVQGLQRLEYRGYDSCGVAVHRMVAGSPISQGIQRARSTARVAELLAQLDAPVIAQVHGVAAGAGLSLMLQADFVLAADNARFNLAYINLGTSCDVGASWALPRLVGLGRALEIAMLGEAFTAPQAQQWGLIHRAVPAAELDAAVQQLAQRLASGPTRAYGHMRRLMRASLTRDLATQLQAEAQAFDDCAHSADLREGIEAFYAKRPAAFQGR